MRSRGNLQRHALAVRRRHLDRCAERRLRIGHRHFDQKIGAATLELLRRLDARDDIQIARRASRFPELALALEPDPRAVLDAGGDLHGVALRPPLATRALALLARLLDDRAVSAAARTRLRQREEPLALRDDATAMALRTDDRGRPRLGAGAAALTTGRRHLDGNLRLETSQGVLERQPDRDLDVGAALRLRPSPAGLPTVEDPAEQIAEVAEVVDREVAAAAEIDVTGFEA